MDFKKKIDNNDINSFLPDNFTIGTKESYYEKFNGNIPEYVGEYLEIKTRPEFNDEKENELKIELIKKKAREENLKIIQEYEEILRKSEEQQSTFSAPFLSLEEDINKLDLDERKGTDDIIENISSER